MNQIQYLITRVNYDKETFCYEEYKARALTNQVDLTKLIFMADAKQLVKTYYKQKALYEQEKLVLTAEKVHLFLSHFELHIPTLQKINSLKFVHIEPLLLVFFSDLHMCVIPKEAMSAVSRMFWIDLRQNYRSEHFA